MDYRLASVTPEALCIQGDDDLFSCGHGDDLTVADPVYVDVPLRFDVKELRLAQASERAYLAARKLNELLPQHVALTIISQDDRFYFVVGGALSYRDGTGQGR
jgi:hypothetical protein